VIGGVADLAGLRNMAAIEAALGLAPDPVRRLAAVAVRILEDAVRLRERLRLSNDEYRRLRVMAERWWRIAPDMGEAAACALLYRIGVENFRDRVLLAFARSRAAANDAAWRALAELPARWTAPKFPLAAKDFLARGLEKGPALGAALAAAEEAWVAAGFPGDAAALAAIAKEAVKAGNVEGERGE
jgi:poly(A) polymerase